MILKLFREGEFKVDMKGDPYRKCGPPESTIFRYEAVVTATSDSLSPEGFVIENGRIQEYMDKTYGGVWSPRSCERIAMETAEGLGTTLWREGISVVSVVMTIHGSNNARIQAEWKAPKPKKKPPMPKPEVLIKNIRANLENALEEAKNLL